MRDYLAQYSIFGNKNVRPARVRVHTSSSLENPSCQKSCLGAPIPALGKESSQVALRKQVLPLPRWGKPLTCLEGFFVTTFPWLPLPPRLLQDPPVSFKEQDFPSKHNRVVVCLWAAPLCREWRASLLMSPGTPVPSLWYIVRGLQGIRVVTRTRWACGLGLLTCSSTHTSKKVITQELD